MHEPILLTLGSKQFKMVLSTPAACDFEELTKKRIYDIQMPPLRFDVVALIWAASKRQSGKDLTTEHVKVALDAAGFPARNAKVVFDALGELLKLGMGSAGEEEDSDSANGDRGEGESQDPLDGLKTS